jgi:hypothetical protein
MPDYRINLDGPYESVPFTRRTLEAREVASLAPLGDLPETGWTHDEEQIVRAARHQAILKLRGFVYAENLGRDTKTVTVQVTVPATTTFPGRRVWWAPWKRRPDVHNTQWIDTNAHVDITRIVWAKLPDAPPFPERFGRPVTFVEFEGFQADDR